jgi:hypothetical protein
MTSSGPELSVVVVVLAGKALLVRCLEALRCQKNAPEMEVIVPHDDDLSEAVALSQRFPDVKFLRASGKRGYAELRAVGVKSSRGPLVAVTEDQCIPPENWCAAVVAAHASPHAAIGGPVEKYRPDQLLNWAVYLRELGSFMPPVNEGPASELTDCNVSYKRADLNAIEPAWSMAFHEHQVHAALRERGGTLWLSPALMTYQQRSLKLRPAVAERYAFGRVYGGLRVGEISIAKRLWLIVASPLLPPLLLVRAVSRVIGKRRYVCECFAALPYLMLFSLVWSCGEFVGYVTGRPAVREAGRRSDSRGRTGAA